MGIGELASVGFGAAGVILAAGAALAQLAQARKSIGDQGRRLGAIEKWQAFEDGRRAGQLEAKEQHGR